MKERRFLIGTALDRHPLFMARTHKGQMHFNNDDLNGFSPLFLAAWFEYAAKLQGEITPRNGDLYARLVHQSFLMM